MLRVSFLALALLATNRASAQTSRADSAGAVGVVEQFHAALAAADSAKAVSLLSDDVMILESGAIQTRADYLGGHLGADMKANQGPKPERTLVKVTVIGDAAYVVSRSISAPAAAGSTGSEMAELMIVGRTSAGWKIRAVHWSSRRRR